jgi:hypothetical protein
MAITIHVLIRGIGNGRGEVDEQVAVPEGTTLGKLIEMCDNAVVPLRASLASSPQAEPLLLNGARCPVDANAGRVLADGDEILVLAQ